MIEKLKKILEKNPNVDYVVLSLGDWVKLCGEVSKLKKDPIYAIYWASFCSDNPSFGKYKILFKEEVLIVE